MAENLKHLHLGLKYCLEADDYIYASYAAFHIPLCYFNRGDPFSVVIHEVQQMNEFLSSVTKIKRMQIYNDCIRVNLNALRKGLETSSLDYYLQPEVLKHESVVSMEPRAAVE